MGLSQHLFLINISSKRAFKRAHAFCRFGLAEIGEKSLLNWTQSIQAPCNGLSTHHGYHLNLTHPTPHKVLLTDPPYTTTQFFYRFNPHRTQSCLPIHPTLPLSFFTDSIHTALNLAYLIVATRINFLPPCHVEKICLRAGTAKLAPDHGQ